MSETYGHAEPVVPPKPLKTKTWSAQQRANFKRAIAAKKRAKRGGRKAKGTSIPLHTIPRRAAKPGRKAAPRAPAAAAPSAEQGLKAQQLTLALELVRLVASLL